MLDHVIRDAAEHLGDRIALSAWDGRTLTYRQLDRRAEFVARRLRQAGVRDGSVVALTLRSDLDYVACYAGAARLGAITAGINPSLSAGEIRQLIAVGSPDVVIDDRMGAELSDPSSDVPSVDVPVLDDDPDRPVAIVFTSGTTGTPKGALFRNRQIDAAMRIDLGLGPDDQPAWDVGPPLLASTQFAHVGFMTKLAWYVRTGSTVHLLDRWTADGVLETVARERIPVVGGVAPQVALLLRSSRLDELDLGCVELLVIGGAASPPGLIRAACDRFQARYSVRYSSTETGGVGLAHTFGPADEPFDTIGRPRPGVEVDIVDGELRIRSDAMFSGYWGNPEATAAALRDGWLHTGDGAEWLTDGGVRLTGRLGDMYIRGGYNVHPAEVEAVLSEHPDVADVAVIGFPDEVMGEKGAAFVVPTAGRPAPDLAALSEFARDRLARWKLPERVIPLDALPLTPMQKVDRAALTAMITDQSLG